jgi:formyltetrahydrofolate-dependent phosphoribosylglycinamide formyltransferase
MLERLQNKWKVSSSRLVLILLSFAIGGSLTGLAAKKLMRFTGMENAFLFGLTYIIMVMILWPLMVLIVSLFFGQFNFFKNYIVRIAGRMGILNIQMNKEPNFLETGSNSQSREQAQSTQPSPNAKPQTLNPAQLAIFASGAGSNAQRIIDHFRGSNAAEIALIVCNKPGAGVIGIAEKEGIKVLMIEKERFFRGDGYVAELQTFRIDLIILAGFLWKIPHALIAAYPRRIVNIHPALLPKYGGKGMYGQYVHEAVLNAGEVESGITIHYVDEHYDNGDVIFQTACPVLDGDSPEKLAKRIHQLEHAHYPVEIEKLVNGLKSLQVEKK